SRRPICSCVPPSPSARLLPNAPSTAYDSRHQPAGGRDPDRGDWHGDGAVLERMAPSIEGGDMSGQRRARFVGLPTGNGKQRDISQRTHRTTLTGLRRINRSRPLSSLWAKGHAPAAVARVVFLSDALFTMGPTTLGERALTSAFPFGGGGDN